MSRLKTTNQNDDEDSIFFKNLNLSKSEPEPWPLATEGELAVDVFETKKEIVIKSAIAGLKPEDLHLSLEGDLLTIKGTRESHEHPNAAYLCKECHWGTFSRSIILPSAVYSQRAKAQLARGILTITLPKAKKGTNIKVNELEEE